jgi:hypothetical protein
MIIHAGAYYLATVYATPAVALRTGFWRLFVKLLGDEDLVRYPAPVMQLPDGERSPAMPADIFAAAGNGLIKTRAKLF